MFVCTILTIAKIAASASASCFLPNGSDRNQLLGNGINLYRPCHTTEGGGSSMCCRTTGGDEDTCHENFLCKNGDIIWRESCTDQTWSSKGCIKLCVDGYLGSTDVPLHRCNDGSWCCDDGNGAGDRCCTWGLGKWIASDGSVVDTNPSLGAPSSSAATCSASSMPTSNSTRSCISSQTGAIIGGVVGGVGGALILALVAFCLLRHRRLRQGAGTSAATFEHTDATEQKRSVGKHDDIQRQELVPESIIEAPSAEDPAFHELDTGVHRGDIRRSGNS